MNALFGTELQGKIRRYLLSRPYHDEGTMPDGAETVSLRELMAYVAEHATKEEVQQLHDMIFKPMGDQDGYSEMDLERRNNIEHANTDFRVHGGSLEPRTPAQPDEWVARPGTEEASAATVEWTMGTGPAILVLSGPPGVGKTHLAAQAANALIVASGLPVAYRTEADMMSEIRRAPDHGQSQDDVADDFASHPWLIIDDFGTEVPTEKWGKGIQDRIINGRWVGAEGGMVRTLITTNFRSEDLADRARIASRLLDRSRSRQVQIKASDWRQAVRR